jgi:hypothetical protein
MINSRIFSWKNGMFRVNVAPARSDSFVRQHDRLNIPWSLCTGGAEKAFWKLLVGNSGRQMAQAGAGKCVDHFFGECA